MASRAKGADKALLVIIGVLIVSGVVIFSSASLGVLARGNAPVSSILLNHLGLGVGLGLIAMIIGAHVDYRQWRRFAPHIFVLALIATALVFVPGIGYEHGGARRWISIFGTSFQPGEALKIAAVLAAAAYFSSIKNKIGDLRYGLGGLAAILALPCVLIILQPDTGTLGIIAASVFAIFFAAGARWRDIGIVIVIGLIFLGALAFMRPYVLDRIQTLFNPTEDPHASGYQIRQSFIAIGSGGYVGRGFGQSVQKFSYLPEPIGDSIFAVAAEEFGFAGAIILVALFLGLALRSFSIAARAPDFFGGLLAVGIGAYLSGEAFINISAMIGIIPLTGVPLTFISHGGSAMLIAMGSAGILLNISRNSARS